MEKEYTFEEAMQRLEEIGQLLNGPELTLEVSMSLFEEGCRLAAFCQQQLEQARQKVTQLTEGAQEGGDPDGQ